jgi:hypothetical protein
MTGANIRKIGPMAEQDKNNDDFSTDEGMMLWSAASLFLLGIADRFRFNRNRYAEDVVIPKTSQLFSFCDELLKLLHSYRALHTHYQDSKNKQLLYGLFLLVHKIESVNYILHHSILELNPEKILRAIEIIDYNRANWTTETIKDAYELPDLTKTEQSIRNAFELKRELELLF